MLRRIIFWTLRMLFFIILFVYSLYTLCKEGNYLHFNVIIALTVLSVLSLSIAMQSLHCLLIILKKD